MPVEFQRLGPIMLPLQLRDGTISTFQLELFRFDGRSYHVLQKPPVTGAERVLVRIESACTYAHLYGSRLCDCRDQLDLALLRISKEGRGLLIFALDEHGRGIGLVDHIRVYMAEQERNLDTVEAHLALGLPVDPRDYRDEVAILQALGPTSIRLMSNNPARIETLRRAGVPITEIVPIEGPLDQYNVRELMIKKDRLGHSYTFVSDQEWANRLRDMAGDRSGLQWLVTADFGRVVATSEGGETASELREDGVLSVYTLADSERVPAAAEVARSWGATGRPTRWIVVSHGASVTERAASLLPSGLVEWKVLPA